MLKKVNCLNAAYKAHTWLVLGILTDHVICPCREVGNGGPYICYCFTLLWQYVYNARFNCVDKWKSIQWKVVECLNRLNEKDKLWKNWKEETNNEKGILKLYFCVWRNYCLWMLKIEWLSININVVGKEQTRLPILFFVFCIHNNLSGLRRQDLQQMGAHLGGSSGIGSTWHEEADPSISKPLGPGGYLKEQWDTRRVPGDRQTAIFILRSRLPQKGWRRAASWWIVLGSGWCGTSRET